MKYNYKLTLAIYVIFLALMILVIANKENYHVDELWSYGLSNNIGSITMSIESGKTYKPASAPYDDFLTVSADQGLNIANVWENQKNDVHPPLYYLLIHIISFICAGGGFSKWIAGGINIIFALLTLHIYRKIVWILSKSSQNVLLFATLAFVLSTGVLAAISFFRMYIIAMFWITSFTYILLKKLDKPEKDSCNFYFLEFGIAVLGALTHYYCIIYIVLISITFCIIQIIGKQFKSIAKYVLTGLGSGLTAYIIFPAMIDHMFRGGRGLEAINNLSNGMSEFVQRLMQYSSLLNREFFAGLLGYMLLFTLLVFVFINSEKYLLKCEGIPFDTTAKQIVIKELLLIFIPCLAYFIFVAKSAPYITTRYMVPIYAVLFSAVFTIIGVYFEHVILEKRKVSIIICLFLSIFIINSWKNQPWEILYKESNDLIEWSNAHSDLDCLYINDIHTYKIQSSFLEVRNYNSVTFLQGNQLDMLTDLEIASQDQMVVLIIPENRDEILQNIKVVYPQLTSHKEIGSFGYARTYYLYNETLQN